MVNRIGHDVPINTSAAEIVNSAIVVVSTRGQPALSGIGADSGPRRRTSARIDTTRMPPMIAPRKTSTRYSEPFGNECTEKSASTPLRVRNVAYITVT